MARTKKPESVDPIEGQTLEGMSVTRLGKGVYACSSESGEAPYHVDIMALDGLGECNCWDFVGRREPRWRTIKKPYDALRCKHLRRVRNWVLDGILQQLIQKENKPNRK